MIHSFSALTEIKQGLKLTLRGLPKVIKWSPQHLVRTRLILNEIAMNPNHALFSDSSLFSIL
jgi:hypothetical protein